MNQIKLLRLLILISLLIILLTACTNESRENKENSNIVISQDQTTDEKSGDKFESVSEDIYHSSGNDEEEDNVDLSGTYTAELDSNGGNSNNNDNTDKQLEETVPSIESEKPSISNEDQQDDLGANVELTYEEYMAMNPTEQKAYYDSYDNFMDFLAWHNAAKAKYDADNESIKIQDGKIDISEIVDITNE